MAKVKFTEYDGKWFKLGKNKFEKQKKDPRNKKCNMFDKICYICHTTIIVCFAITVIISVHLHSCIHYDIL